MRLTPEKIDGKLWDETLAMADALATESMGSGGYSHGFVRASCNRCGESVEAAKPRMLVIGTVAERKWRGKMESRGWEVDSANEDDLGAHVECLHAGCYQFVAGELDDVTWSTQYRPVVRSREKPWGCEGAALALEQQNRVARAMLEFFSLLSGTGTFGCLEMPGKGFLISTDELQRMRRKGWSLVESDDCRFGSRSQGRRSFWVNHPFLHGIGLKCDGGHQHDACRGKERVGGVQQDRSQRRREWSPEFQEAVTGAIDDKIRFMCLERWKVAIAKGIRRGEFYGRDVEDPKARKRLEQNRSRLKMQMMPVSEAWFRPERGWVDFQAGSFNYKQHINLSEMDALGFLVRGIAKHSDMLNSRVLCFSDSQVVVGAASKGRTSSRALQRKLKRVAATCLCGRLDVGLRWVPTHLNPADEPSRRVCSRKPREEGLW